MRVKIILDGVRYEQHKIGDILKHIEGKIAELKHTRFEHKIHCYRGDDRKITAFSFEI